MTKTLEDLKQHLLDRVEMGHYKVEGRQISLDTDKWEVEGRILTFYVDGAPASEISVEVVGNHLTVLGPKNQVYTQLDASYDDLKGITATMDGYQLMVRIPFLREVSRFQVPIL